MTGFVLRLRDPIVRYYAKKTEKFFEAIDIDNSMDLCRLKRRIYVAPRTIVYM